MLMESLAFFSFFSVNTVLYRQHLRRVKETNYCMFHSIKLLKMSCGKRCKWHFRDPKLKNLGGGMPPEALSSVDYGATTFFLHMRTPSKSHSTPLKLY